MHLIQDADLNAAAREAAASHLISQSIRDVQPKPTGCSGNCVQGRFCDCAADIETDEGVPLGPWPTFWFFAIVAAVAVVELVVLLRWLFA